MSTNNLRELRRREMANLEKERMIHRYHQECGEVSTRKATLEEISKTGKKTKL